MRRIFKAQEYIAHEIFLYYSGDKHKDLPGMTEFSNTDIEQIKNHGLMVDAVMAQMADFVRGFPYADITAPATVGNGIIELTDADIARYSDAYAAAAAGDKKIVKFVPASGAATRMFRDLFEFLNTGTMNDVTRRVLDNLDKFAFWNDLKPFLPDNATDHDKIACILTNAGLDYGNLPKGLIAFHKYDNYSRTAVEEHLAEGAQYAVANGMVRIHFTVSPEHTAGFRAILARVVPEYSARYGVKYDITMSNQRASTDTIAVNPDNTPFRTDDGRLLFRPAGHGALIENLNDIDADIVFIKNIDNVTTDALRGDTIKYKRALAGMLVELQSRAFEYLDNFTAHDLGEIRTFIKNDLCVRVPDDAGADALRAILNRPIRVCGVVKNSGAPGGGPFWVRDENGTESLQIVESSQIAPDARGIMNASSHFNPVDLVCGVRDAHGNKFDLTQFVDPKTGFISDKSSGGRALRAMERPGLWNGAMAHWNTVFVAVPASTFTPVKVVTDLLSPEHGNAQTKK